MTDLIIGQTAYKRQQFFATIYLAKPEELVVAGMMRKLGYTSLQRAEVARKLLVSFAQQTLEDGAIGEPLDRIRAELDRLEVSSVALDEAATRVPRPTTEEKTTK